LTQLTALSLMGENLRINNFKLFKFLILRDQSGSKNSQLIARDIMNQDVIDTGYKI
jgi:hypothetical protein